MFRTEDNILDPTQEMLDNPDVLAEWYNRRDSIRVGFTLDFAHANKVIADIRRLYDCHIPVYVRFKAGMELAQCLALIIEISGLCKEIIIGINRGNYVRGDEVDNFLNHIKSINFRNGTSIKIEYT